MDVSASCCFGASLWKIGACLSKARLISSSGCRIPYATGRLINGLPSKRAISTFLSAAIITPCASAISASLKRFPTPPAPFVSTLMRTPSSAACFFKASSAMYVCAIPVVQAVTATKNGASWATVVTGSGVTSCSLNKATTASGVLAAFNSSIKPSWSKKRDKLAKASKCVLLASAGTAIINNKCTGWPSMASYSTPFSERANTTVGSFTALFLLCGMAMPSPKPVVVWASRAKMPCMKVCLSVMRPASYRRSIISSKAACLVVAFRSSIITSVTNKSLIFMMFPHILYWCDTNLLINCCNCCLSCDIIAECRSGATGNRHFKTFKHIACL